MKTHIFTIVYHLIGGHEIISELELCFVSLNYVVLIDLINLFTTYKDSVDRIQHLYVCNLCMKISLQCYCIVGKFGKEKDSPN